MKNITNWVSQVFKCTGLNLIVASSALMFVVGCSDTDGGRVLNTVALPVDFVLELQCPNVGIADETCILDDPHSGYYRSALSNENKFDLHNASPSAKARFYLWGTVMARDPSGENQFYVAQSLHELYTQGSNVNARAQAKKAYRSLLDNYFDSVTYSAPDANGNQVSYPLKDWAGERLYAPEGLSLTQLFDSRADALANMDQWGYIYDITNKIITRK